MVAFLYGWGLLLVIQTGGMVAVTFARYFREVTNVPLPEPAVAALGWRRDDAGDVLLRRLADRELRGRRDAQPAAGPGAWIDPGASGDDGAVHPGPAR